MVNAPHDEIPAEAAGAARHAIDSHFIPVRVRDLVRTLAGDEATFGMAAPRLGEIGTAIERIIGQEMYSFESRLCDLYARVNPDRECVEVTHDDGETGREDEELERAVAHVLSKANFRRLDDVEVSRTLATASTTPACSA